MKCRFCGKEKNGSSTCLDCGTELCEAGGKIIYGTSASDRSDCMVHITKRYLFIGRVSSSYFKKKRVGRGFGLVGSIFADASVDPPKTYGYYPLDQLKKGIFPYLTREIDDENAVKLIMKNGKELILIFDQPDVFDGTRKVRKNMIAKIQAAAEQWENGEDKNFGSVHCAPPLVNAENFDKIGPEFWGAETASTVSAKAAAAPVPPSESPRPLRQEPAPAERASIVEEAGASLIERVPCDCCGTFVVKGKKFCTQCGASMEKKPVKKSVCANCGTLLEEGDRFCNECGTPIESKPEALICANCGELLEEGDRFCNECGAKVVSKPKRPTHCPQCGDELEQEDKFCSSCGYKLT